jgi:hypothetical protein
MKSSTLIRNVFKYAVAVIFFIVSIEICARIDDALRYGAPFWKSYSAECLKSNDNKGIPCNVPNARFQKWHNNSFGFRGPEILAAKTPGTLRVVCLGASESYGLYESPGKEWPAQLLELLPSAKYQVINVSVVGLGFRSYEPYLKKYVLPLEPDVIVCFVNPLFYATSFERTGENKASSVKSANRTEKKPTIALTGMIISNVRCLPKIKQTFKKALQNSFPKELQHYQIRSLQKEVATAEALRLKGRKPKDIVPDASVRSFKNDLSKFVSFLESRHVKVLLSTYPSLISRENLSAYPDIFLDNRRFFVEFSMPGMVDVLEKSNSVVRAVALERGIMFVDCRALVPKTNEYFGDNVHYTDRGARTIAEGIAARLLGKPGVTVMSAAADQEIISK